ncbi:MAG: TlpA family protein disulfide reductase [Gammaproteobacteria bacterium]|jgi:thiol-disulfide isomerase/thioredoxin|nr:TlpA family protein disulfide reductase [Gammaproteobacteria bacterium]MBT4078788.1 TlpA family protein disulfide reductase [Gammaproteobacteria bacterium]MBT4194516.1 TlpA family protein disulfide reductase [Gammaproteobacteria bacterium]MBT4449753.1 TlpA family protein disulfide reductase [Gammaproteobacteria bacterium]MBT4859229.1 TlpA family protein disulfide reductase [Gammaproteobacteria bacterium]
MKRLLLLLLLSVYSFSLYAVDMSLTDLNGKESKLTDYLGKWVVVNYWATWCPPCREEMPELQAFHDKHEKTDGVVLGLNTEVIAEDDIKEFLDDYFVTYPNFRVGPVSDTELGKVPGLPTTFLVSPEGKVEARQVGGVTLKMIEKFIKKWDAKNKN